MLCILFKNKGLKFKYNILNGKNSRLGSIVYTTITSSQQAQLSLANIIREILYRLIDHFKNIFRF